MRDCGGEVIPQPGPRGKIEEGTVKGKTCLKQGKKALARGKGGDPART